MGRNFCSPNSQGFLPEKISPMLEKVTSKFSPAVKYHDDGKRMTLSAQIPKEALETYKVSADGRTITLKYEHKKEHKAEGTYSMESYLRSYAHTTDREIKSCDARIEGENTLLVDVVFEEKKEPEKKLR